MSWEVAMRRTALLLVLSGLAFPASPGMAEMCTLDPVPAATLLLPHFEVDLDAAPGAGVNTVFTIHNALPEPAIAHVTFWTDWSQPTLNFDIFLTGYDQQTVDLYDIFVGGNIPVTADEQGDQGQDGGRVADPTSSCDGTVDSCSPHGSHPSWDGSFTGNGAPFSVDCIDTFPFFVNPLLSTSRRAELQARHSGQPIGGSCFGADHGDGIARGYVTVDNADTCSLIFPSDPSFFSDGVTPGIASNANQLWGDWYFVDPGNVWTLPIDPLVHVEADAAFDASSTATGQTFYGRYTRGEGGIDHREPLGSAWAFSYRDAGPGQVTDLIVWRDSTADDQDYGDGYPCGTGPGSGPDWQPLDQARVVCFDQTEGAVETCFGASCFPLESQRLELGSGDFDVPFAAGWCYLDLDIPGNVISRVAEPPVPPNVTQSWVGATVRGGGMVAGGLSAVALASACQDAIPVIQLEMFADGFESGDTSAWSATMP